MLRVNTLEKKVDTRISRKKSAVILREDLRDLGGDDQVSAFPSKEAFEQAAIGSKTPLGPKTKRSYILRCNSLIINVGTERFELPTSCL